MALASVSRSESHGAKHLPEAAEALEGPIVDLGCGEGIFAELSRSYVGLDRDVIAAERVRGLGRAVLVGDVARAPLKSGAFGGALLVNLLHEVGDPEAVLGELDRLLRPGGRFYLKNRWHKGGGRPSGWAGRLARALHLHHFRYWDHGWRHGPGRIHRTPNPDGTWGICPACVQRWFEGRGYAVRRPWSQVLVGEKGR
jgi:SAM-dependent methyltransferase